MANNIQRRVFSERHQSPETRKTAIEEVQKFLDGRTLVTFFTSFRHPVEIEDDDCDMLQSILQHSDLQKGLALMIDSPGGNGLAAERIVNTCRAYSGTGDYWAIVPGRAKSAATIICMGASKIMMAAPSELGPVDPQIIRREGTSFRVFSAHSLISGFDKLFKEAVTSKGNLEPFIQQLQKYDIREINTYRDQITLSEDIAIKVLKSGVMGRRTKDQIRKKIEIFLDPSKGTFSHGRAINRDEARDCDLPIQGMDVQSDQWLAIYALYCRTELFVSSQVASKAVESLEEQFFVAPPKQR